MRWLLVCLLALPAWCQPLAYVWRFGGPPGYAPVQDSKRFVVYADDTLWAGSLQGELLWKRRLETIYQAPVLVDGCVILRTPSGLTALNAEDGQTLWNSSAHSEYQLVQGQLWARNQQTLERLNPHDGTITFSIPKVERWLRSDPLLVWQENQLRRLDPKTGLPLWSLSTKVYVSADYLYLDKKYWDFNGKPIASPPQSHFQPLPKAPESGYARGPKGWGLGASGWLYHNGRKLKHLACGAHDYNLVGWGGDQPQPRVLYLAQPSLSEPQVASLLAPGRHTFAAEGSNLGVVRLSLQHRGKTIWSAEKPTPSQGWSNASAEAVIKEPGAYQLVVEAAGRKRQTDFQVTRLGSVCKYSAQQVDVFVFDYLSGRPAPNIPVSLLGQNQKTDPHGLAHFRLNLSSSAKISVQGVEQELRFENPPALGQIYLRSDRPLYRPGHTVEFYALVAPQSRRKVSLQLRDPSDNLLQTLQLESDANGLLSGSLPLSPEAPLGRYRLLAQCPELNINQSLPLDVQAYRKPPFELKLSTPEPLYLQGQSVPLQISSQYFFGGPVAHAKIKVQVNADRIWDEPAPPEDYEPNTHEAGWYSESLWEGEVETDEQGKAVVKIPTRKNSYDQRLHIQASAVGAEGQPVEAASQVTLAAARFGIYIQPIGWVHDIGESFQVRVHTVDRMGQPHSAPFRLRAGGQQWKGSTNAQGQAVVTIKLSEWGYLDLLASSQDEHGRKTEDVSYVWITGAGGNAWRELELVPARHKVKPGSSLKVLLLGSHPGPVWLTVEGKRVLWQSVVQLKDHSQTFKIPIQPDWEGRLEIHAHSGDSSTSSSFTVDNQPGRLGLQLSPDRPDYRPGKTARLTIQASQPAALVLSLVDDALYSLRPEYAADLYQALHASRHDVEEVQLLPQKGRAAGFQTIQPPIQVRSQFKDTAFWKVGVLTDDQGRAEISLPLPENLTRWRGIVQGVSLPPSELRVGQAQTSLLTKLPVSVRTIVPRFAVEGDQFQARALVNNQLAQPIQAQTEIQKQPAGQAEVPAQATRTFSKILEAPAYTDKPLEVTSQVRAEPEADAERKEIPLLPFGSRHKEFLSTQNGEFEVQAPAEVRQPRLQLRLNPSLISLIESSLDYLADYPYGCAEQTMSRFGPTLVAVKAAQKLGLTIHKPVDAMVAAGLQKLYGYQHDDGGWGWWTYDDTHPYMTGYVLAGLSQARDLGYAVDTEVVTRGIACTQRLFSQEIDPEVRAYLTWSLTQAGQTPELKDDPKLSLYAQALLLQSAVKQNQTALAQTLAARLKAAGLQDASASQQHPHLTGPEQPPWLHWQARSLSSHGFLDDDLEASCQILRGLMALDPQDPQVNQGLGWILSARRGQAWKTTKDTAQVVYLLSDLLASSSSPLQEPVLSLDGAPQSLENTGEQLRVIPMTPGQKLKVNLSGVHSASLQLDWVDPPFSSQLPAEASSEFSLQRSYYKGRQRLFAPLHLKPQEEVTVQLDLICEKPLQYVMLQDYRAAGMEAVSANQNSRNYAQREDRDDRTVFFFTSLSAGRHSLRYTQRAETPGSFRVLPAQAELMYQPDLRARGGSDQVEISAPEPEPR
ncbi:PQQ-binding-like beta-propeller repeat protein [bacterium]|nr:PQQ-binding-like beta-propeller repeat protein [bacterium]